MKLATKIIFFVLVFVALAHLVRVFYGWEVIIGGWAFPVWGSIIGAAIVGVLAFFLYREHRT